MTEKLYYQDSHRKEFQATVVSCEPYKQQYRIVLDRTAFFPEGGGQYADTGMLDAVNITDVHEKDGIIYHTADAPLEAGSRVTGRIHWEERFEKMQQHTGEHIVSGLVHKRFGYQNVGFHLGSDYCTMDFNGPITKEELREIEQEANEAVFQNLDIEVLYPTKEELAEMEYRSKIEIEGQVRIVVVPGYDVCACCAPHVDKTGEIGMIKLVNMINYKGGERITMLCGRRALRDYEKKEESTKAISAMLCAKEYEVAEAVEHLKEEQASLKSQCATLWQKLLSYQANEVVIEDGITAVFEPSLSGNLPREMMNLLLDRGAKICAVFTGSDEVGYRYVIGSRSEDVRPLSKRLNAAFDGRGGGKPEMVQGSMKGTERAIREMID
ncbi:alanyl-tRNA editing protein [Faecalicatena contorta]|uniref:alanyl-tRNA editing protein n=1 Tax=Faecalicatena contorta TaxID=39482 RepID=UPI001F4692AF|nr:alanyl-tRNA editing protein [Faecalicatena contorta]MCF2682572.1 alanyl-tRNA editing protein [Faecalicatena contorta]